MQPSSLNQRRGSVLGRIFGGFVLVTSVAVGFFIWFVPQLLFEASADLETQLSEFAILVIESRHWLPVLVVPSLVLAGIAMFARKRNAIYALLALVLIVVPVAMVIITFVLFLAPLYTYQPLT